MTRYFRLILALFALLLTTIACDNAPRQSSDDKEPRLVEPRADKYPIPFLEREYTDIHESAKQAWFLTETAYFVVKEKYKTATGDRRQSIADEINDNIFGVNDEVEALFKEAIEAEPKNPLNHATYAFYLKPRKRIGEDDTYIPADKDALEQIDKAIELWPDNSAFYLQKIFILTAPHQAHDYLRSGAMEELAISESLDEVRDLFTKAERYDPKNAFINYWKATLLSKYSKPEDLSEVDEEIMREIRAGNQKMERNMFVFPPPVPAETYSAKKVLLDVSNTEAVYFDHWYQYGTYSIGAVNQMVMRQADRFSWPADKQQFAELMFFYYNIARTEPFDRTYFSMQHILLDKMRAAAGEDSADKAKFADVGRFLNDQYRTVANELFAVGVITDPGKVNVEGLHEVENGPSRQLNLKSYIQGPHASYLKHFSETFDVKFPLPDDPEKW